MKLFTIQPIEFYNELMENNIIHCLEKHVINNWPEFIQPYNWMINQMKSRLPNYNYNNEELFPIWCWYQYSLKQNKPDLRHTALLPSGTNGVRIEFEKNDNEVLLSDFILWHYPLNYWYLAKTNEEEINFDNLLLKNNLRFGDVDNYPNELKQLIEESWNNIFNIKKTTDKIQATIWNIKKEEIVNVDFFKVR